jgi:hypothetical protein
MKSSFFSYLAVSLLASTATVLTFPRMAYSADATPAEQETFMETCTSAQMPPNITQTQLDGYCQCVLTGFMQDDITEEQIDTLSMNPQDPAQWAPNVREVINSCVGEYFLPAE